jgi:segregation and condensation protein B
MEIESLKQIVEGVLLAAGGPMSLNQINALFPDDEKPGHGAIKEALAALDADLEGRAVELVEVGSGYRIQIRTGLMPVISQLWSEKPPRYSRALLETLAIIAYRQPITRGDIEQIRGVAVSSNILRTLQERDWIKVVGHRDVPGRPELLGTTKGFLDYFNLKSLDQLPTLAEIKDIDNLEPELELTHPAPPDSNASAPTAPGNESPANAEADSDREETPHEGEEPSNEQDEQEEAVPSGQSIESAEGPHDDEDEAIEDDGSERFAEGAEGRADTNDRPPHG